MQAIFYQITKRSNSTKLPTGGRTFEINLKSPCTIIDPEIKIATESNPTGYNYCNIPILAGTTGLKLDIFGRTLDCILDG